MGNQVRVYDYVNHAYERVRGALSVDPEKVFQSATKVASARGAALAAELKFDWGGMHLGADIAIVVTGIDEQSAAVPGNGTNTRIQLEWRGATAPWLFPFMKADFSIYPLTRTETQLDFSGSYEPPLGVLGGALNALVGHRIAEGTVHRFVSDVAEYLRKTLTG